MSIAPTVKYFGRLPSVIVMQSSSGFDGSTVQATSLTNPTITPGVYTFAVQTGGGVYNFHDEQIEVRQIAYSGGGTCTVTRILGVPGSTPVSSTLITTLTTAAPAFLPTIFLAPGEYLAFVSSGGTNPVLSITANLAAFVSDGAA